MEQYHLNENGERKNDEKSDVEALRTWMDAQPTLPHAQDDNIVAAFIKWAKPNEKNFAYLFYKIRQHYKQIFRNRQPGSDLHERYSSVAVAPFTTATSTDFVIFGIWLTNDNPNTFCAYHQAKLIMTELDLLLQEGCLTGKRILLVIDMGSYTLKHVEKITKFCAKTIAYVFATAVPAQLGGVFLINVPEWVSEYTKLFPSFDFHVIDNTSDLAGFIPQELLPSDLGGPPDNPTREECEENFTQRLWQYSNWLAHEEILRDQELDTYSTTPEVDAMKQEESNKKL